MLFLQSRPFDQNQFNEDVFRLVEEPFTYDRSPFPTEPIGKLDRQNNKIILHPHIA